MKPWILVLAVLITATSVQAGIHASGVEPASEVDAETGLRYIVVDVNEASIPEGELACVELSFDSSLNPGTEVLLWTVAGSSTLLPWMNEEEPRLAWKMTERKNGRRVRLDITEIAREVRSGAAVRILVTARGGDEGMLSFPDPGRLNVVFHTR